MSLADAIHAAVTPGVTERPPVAEGMSYAAFVVHPHRPGPIVLAIAHSEGETMVVDVVRERINVEDCAELLQRYSIAEVTGAPSEGDELAHAVCGVIDVLRRRGLQ